jgi:hypothetical protein
MLTSGLNFFGLSSSYKETLIEEFYFLAKFIRINYSDFYRMPTFERKHLIKRIVEDNTPKTT